MSETPEIFCDGSGSPLAAAGMPELKAWFVREVLPLEANLMQFLRHNWRDHSDIEDILHDVYVRVYEAARRQIPDHAKAFVFTTARNLLSNRIRERAVIPIDAVSDLDALNVAIETPDPERGAVARDELRRISTAIDRLPPRGRQVVMLRRVDGLSRGEIAVRMGISEDAVSVHLSRAMDALASILFGDATDKGERP
ncbi:MAG TPA: RNA polymerase sigma factor [Rhizomicrobium sp.]